MSSESGTSSKKRNAASSETTTLNSKLSHDELLKQLKALAKELQGAEQSSNASCYDAQAAFLASPFIIKHKDKDIKLHAALCLVDILRVYAPEAPFDKDQMWDIFSLVISQLKGLEHGRSESKYNYKTTFYILESLALVRTFNICAELDFQDLILQLFKLLFSIVNEKHTIKEQTFMVEIMSPIFQESESISQELLDTVLINIIEPKKSRNPAAYKVACILIQRTSTNIEPFIQMFFNSVLTLGKTSESDLSEKVYDLILELNRIASPVLLSVLPQLEFKLKSTEVEERLTVTKLLAQMFSDPDSELATQNKPLWNCFLERFHDINVDLRIECVKSAKRFLLSHPELARDITEKLRSRCKDPDERVRQEVVAVSSSAASENMRSFSDTAFEEVCERMRDKKLSVRGEALMSLGKLYKGYIIGPNADAVVAKKLYWLPSKLLNGYYQNMVEDRLYVERVLSGCLVPVTLKTKERMKLLFSLYNQLDEHAVEAFKVLLKCQANVRADLAALVRLSENEKSEENDTLMLSHVITLARAMPDPFKSQENLKKLQSMLNEARTRELFKIAVDVDAGCPAVFKAVADIVVQLGARNPILETVKALLDRASPVMIDAACIKSLFEMVKEVIEGLADEDEDDYGSSQKEIKGMELLLTLSEIFPSHFRNKECYETILVFLKHNDQQIVNHALNILSKVAEGMETTDKDIVIYYQPVLTQLACKGTPQQAKFAMKSIAKIFKEPASVFDRIFTSVLDNLEYDHPLLLSYLTTLAQMAVLAPSIFETRQKAIIKDFVVKELLVKDRSTVEDSDSQGDNEWCDDCDVTRESQAKVKGIKLMIRWLQGLQNNHHTSVLPVLRLLNTLLANGGDLQNNGCVCSHDCSRLRLAASCGMLKIAQEMNYEDAISLENFQQLALIMQDVCADVKTTFTKKLHKALDSLKLPLEYLAIFALAASETDKERKTKVRQMISRNVAIRKEYLKQHSAAQACSHSLLPEYALPAVIHLLAHHPDFKPKDSDSLVQFREYLWFFMEPILSSKTENSGLLKKLVETIKQTKDAQNPEDQDSNEAMYTLCDLTYGLIVSKASGLAMEEFPGQPLLPKKMFVPSQLDVPNTKSYLPAGFVFQPGKKTMKPAKTTTNQKNTQKSLKVMMQKLDDNDVKTKNARSKSDTSQRNGSLKRTKETEESEEDSGPSSPPPVKRRVLNGEKHQKSTKKEPRKQTPKQTHETTDTRESSPESEPVKPKSTKKEPKTSQRKTAQRTSPRKQSSSNKRSPFKADTQPSKSGKVPKRLQTELDVSPDEDPLDSPSPIPARTGKQKAKVKEQASLKKQAPKKRGRQSKKDSPPVSPKKQKTSASPSKSPRGIPVKRKAADSSDKSSKSTPVKRKTTAKSPRSTPVKEKTASSSSSPRKSPKSTPVKRKTTTKSPKGTPVKRKTTTKSPRGTPVKGKPASSSSSPTKSPKGTPVKRKPVGSNKKQKTASSPSKRTRAEQPSPAKRQKTDSPSKAKQSTLNIKRRTTRKR